MDAHSAGDGDLINSLLRRVHSFAYTPHRLYAAALLRIGLGSITALFYLMHLKLRDFVWGPSGQLDWPYYKEFITRSTPVPIDLYSLSPSSAWSECMFWSGVVISVLFALGVVPRITSFLFYISTFSIFSRNYVVLDGGQNISWILAFYLCFADTGRYFSLVSIPLGPILRHFSAGWMLRVGTLFHNLAMAAIVIQVAIVYFWSGFYKVMGHKWQDGTAIYYILRVREFTLPSISEHIYRSGALVTIATYGTWMFECSFPFMIWFPKLRPWYFVAAVLMHGSIGVFMGLVMFSSTMIVADLCIFSDPFYDRIFAGLARVSIKTRAFLEGLLYIFKSPTMKRI
jgi:hypothetical protein